MTENAQAKAKGFSIDWLVKGTLTKVGDIFDRLTGRGWKPSSSLATSGLIERMKSVMDDEVREDENGRRYVPHNIQLKMQWDKFSTDSEEHLRRLENEFLIAAVDHINDRHYYTYSPIAVTIKPDYFTSGVVLLVSFDKFDSDDNERAINVTVDGLSKEELLPDAEPERKIAAVRISFHANGKAFDKALELEEGSRLSVGRTKENAIQIDDQSISKAHASLLLNKEGRLVVADTGSTNGTFINGKRISYGKAVEITPGASLMFGLVNVSIHFVDPVNANKTDVLPAKADGYKVGELEFTSRKPTQVPAPTEPSVPILQPIPQAIAKPDSGEVPPNRKPPNDYATDISPQPTLSEPGVKLQENNSEKTK
jgi:pSer/pThr/pTyr-binding forkhead associated (FHA) protein